MSADVKIRILSEDKTKQGIKSVDDKLLKLVGTLGLAVVAVTALKKGFQFVVESTKYAARVETLAVVTQTLGKNAGYTAAEIRELEKAIQAQGITTESSRQSLALMMQAELDLADATDLARLAQDAAVVAGIDSSQAFQRLINVISTGNVRMARTMGLQVDFNAGYKAMAAELGKTVEELTAQEKAQSRANSVMEEGTQIAGAYENSMESVGKQLTSTKRYWDEYRKAVGEVNVETLGFINRTVQELLKAETEALNIKSMMHDAMQLGIMDQTEYDEILMKVHRSGESLKGLTEGLAEAVEEETARREELIAIAEMENDLRGEMIDLRSGEIEAADQLIKRNELLAAAQERTLVTTTQLLDGINRSIASPIENFIKDLEWFMATGGRIEAAFEQVRSLTETGQITPEKGMELGQQLLLGTLDVQEQLGMLSSEEAATRGSEALKMDMEEIQNIIAGTDGIEGAMMRVDEIAAEAQGVLSFRDSIRDAHNELQVMSTKQWDIDIRLNYTSSGRGAAGTQGATTSTSQPDGLMDSLIERFGDLQ